MTDLHLDLYWRSRHPSQADDARRLSRFVNGLPDFDPVYRSWVGSPETKEQTVPVPLSEAEATRLLIENMMRYDWPPDPWPEGRAAAFGAATPGLRPMTFARRASRSPAAILAHTGSHREAIPSKWVSRTCVHPRAARGARQR